MPESKLYVSPFKKPLSSGPMDREVGIDELGRPIYETITGRRYTMGVDPDQRTPRKKASDAVKAGKKAVADWWDDPSLPSGEQVKDAAVGVVQGAYDQIDRLVHGEGTLGEALGVAPVTAVPSFLRVKPKGSGKKTVDVETEENFPDLTDQENISFGPGMSSEQWQSLLTKIEDNRNPGEFVHYSEKEDLLRAIMWQDTSIDTFDKLDEALSIALYEGDVKRIYQSYQEAMDDVGVLEGILDEEAEWELPADLLDPDIDIEGNGILNDIVEEFETLGKPKTPPPPAKKKQVVSNTHNPKENPLIRNKREVGPTDEELHPENYYNGVRIDDIPEVVPVLEFINKFNRREYIGGSSISPKNLEELRDGVRSVLFDDRVQGVLTENIKDYFKSERFDSTFNHWVTDFRSAKYYIEKTLRDSINTFKDRQNTLGDIGSATTVASYYNPIVSSLEVMDWPSKGAKGSVINNYLDKKASGIRASLMRSVKSKSVGKIHGEQELFDPNKRYTLEEATDIIQNNSFGLEAVKFKPQYEEMQRFSRSGWGAEEDYGEIILRTTGHKMARMSGDHYGEDSLGHTRYSSRVTEDGNKYLLVEELQSDLVQRSNPDRTPRNGEKLPPIDSNTEFVRPLIHALIVEAKRQGIGRIVIPSAEEYVKVRDRGATDGYHSNKIRGFSNVYDKAVNKVLAELDREQGVDVSIGADTFYLNELAVENSFEPASPVRVIDLEALEFNPDEIELRFAEGGLVPDMDEQTEMAFMAEDENVDPVSGNEIPPGSTAKEVRDDVPVRLSEGEFVIPANVVKYFGVKYFYDLIRKGEEGMAKELDDLPFDVSELQYEEEQPQT